MKKFFNPFLASVFALISICSSPALAQGETEPDTGAVVCPPDAYLTPPGDCLPLGPSVYLTELGRLGLTFPPRAISIRKPDPSLTQIPHRFFHLDHDIVPVLNGPAGNPTGPVFGAGFVYVTYVDRVDTGKGIYYMLQDGGWIPGKGSRVSEVSSYQGLEFTSTPKNAFGWAFEYIPIKTAPGYFTAETGEFLNPFRELIQVYDTQTVDGADWNMIGLNRWVEARKVAIIHPSTLPPEGVTTARWIDVDLSEQTLAVYENHQLVFATVIASGLGPFWTRPGVFQIYSKKETETMRNNDPADFYYLDNVPWTMYFDKARALHGAYWRTRFGYPQSHGCVNLSVGDAHWLYNWANEGDWVYIHDPSGLTPTDPALYKDWAY